LRLIGKIYFAREPLGFQQAGRYADFENIRLNERVISKVANMNTSTPSDEPNYKRLLLFLAIVGPPVGTAVFILFWIISFGVPADSWFKYYIGTSIAFWIGCSILAYFFFFPSVLVAFAVIYFVHRTTDRAGIIVATSAGLLAGIVSALIYPLIARGIFDPLVFGSRFYNGLVVTCAGIVATLAGWSLSGFRNPAKTRIE
jgi:hypothetical protein